MEYEIFVEEVNRLDFVNDRATADAAVKAVLGILASRLSEPKAQRLTEKLPGPLEYDRLRGLQARPLELSVDEYVQNIARQFHLNEAQAARLIIQVLHFTKDAIGVDKEELKSELPYDWADLIDGA